MSTSNILYETWMREQFLANAALVALVGQDKAGIPAIFPYHFQDSSSELVPYPHLTFARFGSGPGSTMFQNFPALAIQMDHLKFALCAWSQESVTEADQVYSAAQVILQGLDASTTTSSQFGQYILRRTMYRNDLYDDDTKAFHVHAEYTIWINKNLGQ